MTDDSALDDMIEACTRKKAYSTPESAGRAAAGAKARRDVDLRVYACPLGGHYHLTKAEMSEQLATHVLDLQKKVGS